ncbi:MAG: chemotaxis protein, partial [Comamonadaceae bacterium]
ITRSVDELDGITRRNAQMVDEATQQAGSLKERSATLAAAVSHFRLMQGTAAEALALVRRAQAAARGRDPEQFLRHVTDPAQGFHDRDMYVFALDAQGCYRAFGGNPAKVGTRVQDIPGVRGDALLDAIRRQAEREPGWVEYAIHNPALGTVQDKMSYVLKLGEVYLGCGVYQRLAA